MTCWTYKIGLFGIYKGENCFQPLSRILLWCLENLTAADIILFSRRNILGCATDLGGPTSHVSLMARGLGVPAIINMKDVTKYIEPGDFVILDGFNGRLIVNPHGTNTCCL